MRFIWISYAILAWVLYEHNMPPHYPSVDELLQLDVSTLVEMLAQQINDLSKLRKAEGFAPHVFAAKDRILTLHSVIEVKKFAALEADTNKK